MKEDNRSLQRKGIPKAFEPTATRKPAQVDVWRQTLRAPVPRGSDAVASGDSGQVAQDIRPGPLKFKTPW